MIVNFKDPCLTLINAKEQVEEIFFDTSTRKEFKNQEERNAFSWKYLHFYLCHFPEYAWVALNKTKVLGYVLGIPFTQDPTLYQLQPHLEIFEDLFDRYPAHLHINCHQDSRGLGIGTLLIGTLIKQLSDQGLSGLHIMTGPISENRHFYQRLGFTDHFERSGILFMGKPALQDGLQDR
jgi:GNAT superfamily N-acetyltransferase